MTRRTTRRTRIRRRRVAALLVVLAALVAVLGDRWPASAPSIAYPSSTPFPDATAEPPREAPRRRPRAAQAQVHGAIDNLDEALLAALRRAATAARGDGVEFVVNSGWRSPEHQAQLLREAVATYGSEREAARWVASPETSPHVSGDAVDIAPPAARAWLSAHGAAYGLCQIYGNEPWHYELRPDAVEDGCPPMYADPTQDPRMHQ